MQKPSNARGTRDFGPQIMAKRQYVFQVIQTEFQRFGFQAIETPAVENLSVLMGKYGEEGDQLLFKILNSGDFAKDLTAEDLVQGPKKLTMKIAEKGLRYDLTVPFARFVAMNRNELVFPFKRYQMQPVWRADRPQKGRYREFYQCDADVIGSDALINEVELMHLFISIFQKLNIQAELKINHRKILAGLVEVMGKSEEFMRFATILDKLDKIGWEATRTQFEEMGIAASDLDQLAQLFELKGQAQWDLLQSVLASSVQGMEGLADIQEILSAIQASQAGAPSIAFDLSLARGLSYYTGTIFEGKALEGDFQPSIAGGGRYDNLTAAFGLPNVSGVGLSFGIERILDVLEACQKFPALALSASEVLLIYMDKQGQSMALASAQELRTAGISTELYPEIGKLKKAFEYAHKKQIPFVGLIGESELQAQKISLKDMKNGTQALRSMAEIRTEVLNARP